MAEDSKLKCFVVAIDGTSASGKTTLAKNIAEIFHWRYLLTGNLYRILAKKLLDSEMLDGMSQSFEEIVKECARSISTDDLDNPSLGTEAISLKASIIAANTFVREILNDFQRSWILKHGRVIVEGRDIGTVIWPQARVKFFITAAVEVRAERRFRELQMKGDNGSYQDVLQDLIARDRRDQEREVAPLRIAKDACILDSSSLSIADLTDQMVKIIEKRIDNTTDQV